MKDFKILRLTLNFWVEHVNVSKNYSRSLYDQYVDDFGLTRYRLLKNDFNFVHRAIQTLNRSTKVFLNNIFLFVLLDFKMAVKKEQAVNTDPVQKVTFSDNVTQWAIFEAYNLDDEKKVKSRKKLKKKYIQNIMD